VNQQQEQMPHDMPAKKSHCMPTEAVYIVPLWGTVATIIAVLAFIYGIAALGNANMNAGFNRMDARFDKLEAKIDNDVGKVHDENNANINTLRTETNANANASRAEHNANINALRLEHSARFDKLEAKIDNDVGEVRRDNKAGLDKLEVKIEKADDAMAEHTNGHSHTPKQSANASDKDTAASTALSLKGTQEPEKLHNHFNQGEEQ